MRLHNEDINGPDAFKAELCRYAVIYLDGVKQECVTWADEEAGELECYIQKEDPRFAAEIAKQGFLSDWPRELKKGKVIIKDSRDGIQMNIECMLIGGPFNGERVPVPVGFDGHPRLIAFNGELYELGNSGHAGYRFHVGSAADHSAKPSELAIKNIEFKPRLGRVIIESNPSVFGDNWVKNKWLSSPEEVKQLSNDGWVSK